MLQHFLDYMHINLFFKSFIIHYKDMYKCGRLDILVALSRGLGPLRENAYKTHRITKLKQIYTPS